MDSRLVDSCCCFVRGTGNLDKRHIASAVSASSAFFASFGCGNPLVFFPSASLIPIELLLGGQELGFGRLCNIFVALLRGRPSRVCIWCLHQVHDATCLVFEN